MALYMEFLNTYVINLLSAYIRVCVYVNVYMSGHNFGILPVRHIGVL